MTNVIEFISCFLDIVIVFIYFNGILERKEGIGKIFWLYFCIAVLINFARTNLYLPFASNIFATIILWSLIAVFCFGGSYIQKSFFVTINAITIVISEILTALFISTFLKIEYDDGLTMRYLGIALSTTLLFVFNLFTIYIAKKKYRNLPIKYNVLMILCPLFSLYILMLLDSYIAQSPNHNYFMSFLAVLGLGYINIMVFDFFDYYEKGLQAQTLDVVLKANEENYKILEQNEKELHILRHDILKHMAEIKEMLNAGNKEAASQYVDDIHNIVLENTSISRTGNIVLDSILNTENKKAAALGIKYDVKLNISDKINIPSIDLSRILYNAIDNAIEACEKINKKYILVSITSDEKMLKIIIENTSPYVDISDNKIKTTKSDHIRHGYGIKSIKDALKNNDGLLSLSYKNGIFVCRIILKNTVKQKNDVVCVK